MDFSPTPLSGPNVFKSGQKIPISSAGLPSCFLASQHPFYSALRSLRKREAFYAKVLLGQTDRLDVAGGL